MLITVTNSSASLGSLLSAADLQIVKSLIGVGTPVTVTFYNNQSGQVLYVETLGNAAATASSWPVAYQTSFGLNSQRDNILDTIFLIGSAASVETRVLFNAVQLTREQFSN